nr:MAG TPA: hypothetical protein [Caudoviricetes sp.]
MAKLPLSWSLQTVPISATVIHTGADNMRFTPQENYLYVVLIHSRNMASSTTWK